MGIHLNNNGLVVDQFKAQSHHASFDELYEFEELLMMFDLRYTDFFPNNLSFDKGDSDQQDKVV